MVEEESIGIQGNVSIAIGMGFVGVFSYFLLLGLIPGFSLGLPVVLFSVGGLVVAGIVMFLAPMIEEPAFNKVLLEFLDENLLLFVKSDPLRYFLANFIKSGVFSLYHLLVYGVILGYLATLAGVWSAFYANLALFVGAFLFSFITGYILKIPFVKKNLLSTILAHVFANAYTWVTFTGLLVFGGVF